MKPVLVITVRIEEQHVDQCRQFAEACVGTNTKTYAKRGQHNPEKIKDDIFTGKMGEIAVWDFLQEYGVEITKPDFEIYKGRRKSWAADLQITEAERTINVHCKTQTQQSVKKYGTSWILQYAGNGYGHKDALFKSTTDNDFIATAVLRQEEFGYYVDIYAVTQFNKLVELELIKPPVLKHLQHVKRAIYYEDLLQLGNEQLFSILNLIKSPEYSTL